MSLDLHYTTGPLLIMLQFVFPHMFFLVCAPANCYGMPGWSTGEPPPGPLQEVTNVNRAWHCTRQKSYRKTPLPSPSVTKCLAICNGSFRQLCNSAMIRNEQMVVTVGKIKAAITMFSDVLWRNFIRRNRTCQQKKTTISTRSLFQKSSCLCLLSNAC